MHTPICIPPIYERPRLCCIEGGGGRCASAQPQLIKAPLRLLRISYLSRPAGVRGPCVLCLLHVHVCASYVPCRPQRNSGHPQSRGRRQSSARGPRHSQPPTSVAVSGRVPTAGCTYAMYTRVIRIYIRICICICICTCIWMGRVECPRQAVSK